MMAYFLKRLVQCIPLLLLVSLLSFGLIKLVPGDPAIVMGGTNATAAEIEVIRKNLGLDRPFHVQILSFYGNLAQGDLGRSLMLGQPVRDAILERVPATLAVALYSMLLTLLVGLTIGVLAALRHNTWVDQALMTVALLGVSLPNFWLGLVLILVFSVHLLATHGRLCRALCELDRLAAQCHIASCFFGATANWLVGPHHPIGHAGGFASGLHSYRARQRSA